jgi:hypothetical protein
MKGLLYIVALGASLPICAESWKITNAAHKAVSVATDKETVTIQPGKTKPVMYDNNSFTLEFKGMGGRTHSTKYSSDAKSLTINPPLSNLTITEA